MDTERLVANTHPVVLDERGAAKIYLKPGMRYKVELWEPAWRVEPACLHIVTDVGVDDDEAPTCERHGTMVADDESGRLTFSGCRSKKSG